ncbi:MAG TPA: inorganic phosphate transporter, partial [Novosphingobium sp.]|nr:inorganic phosphate transporter [Novosphingobium sp.]
MNASITAEHYERPDLEGGLGLAGQLGFGAAILAALGYVAYSVYADASAAGVSALALLPFALLFLALLIALG